MKSSLSTKWLILKNGVEKYLIKNFDTFVPASSGDPKSVGRFTILNINQIFPLLSNLLSNLKIKINIISIKKFSKNVRSKDGPKILKKKFNEYQSDKSSVHNYHLIYGSLFKKRNKVKKILEIGLGTNNKNIVSNMGENGKPGASIKAFKDFFFNADIYGADIDKKILFKEKRIKTFYVDQTKIGTLNKLYKKIGNNFDLIIDDGLHVTNANVNVILSSLKYVKKNGYLIIEDIPFKTKPIWEVISFILSAKYETIIVKAKQSFVFIIKKK